MKDLLYASDPRLLLTAGPLSSPISDAACRWDVTQVTGQLGGLELKKLRNTVLIDFNNELHLFVITVFTTWFINISIQTIPLVAVLAGFKVQLCKNLIKSKVQLCNPLTLKLAFLKYLHYQALNVINKSNVESCCLPKVSLQRRCHFLCQSHSRLACYVGAG